MGIWHTKEEKPEVATGFTEASLLIKKAREFLEGIDSDYSRCSKECIKLQKENKNLVELLKDTHLCHNCQGQGLVTSPMFDFDNQGNEISCQPEQECCPCCNGKGYIVNETKDKQIQSLQTKLQQAKEGLEFYAKAKHFEEHSHYDIMLEWGEKARETLEIINKE